MTGPQLLTFEGALAVISTGTGNPVAFESVPLDTWVEVLTADGVPPEILTVLSHVFSETLDGRNRWLGDGVQRALRREPRSFAAYVAGATAAQAWG